jgi:hypothetical protein
VTNYALKIKLYNQPTAYTLNMPKELEPSTNEKQFTLEALRQGLRLDGRDFDSFRPLGLSFGREFGLADVQLGKTRYMQPPITRAGSKR